MHWGFTPELINSPQIYQSKTIYTEGYEGEAFSVLTVQYTCTDGSGGGADVGTTISVHAGVSTWVPWITPLVDHIYRSAQYTGKAMEGKLRGVLSSLWPSIHVLNDGSEGGGFLLEQRRMPTWVPWTSCRLFVCHALTFANLNMYTIYMHTYCLLSCGLRYRIQINRLRVRWFCGSYM